MLSVLPCMVKMDHPPCQSKLAQDEACLFRSSSDMSVMFNIERCFYTLHLENLHLMGEYA